MVVVEKQEMKKVIKFKTGASYGFAPLPETTFKLITDGSKDKVQLVHSVGKARKSITIKVPKGTHSHWIEKLTAIHDGQKHLDSMRVTDGNMQDLWFVSDGKKVHLHWSGPADEEVNVINDLTNWLYQMKPENWNDD